MTAKEHLQTVYAIEQKINRIEERREDLRADMFSLGSPQLDSDRVQTSPNGDRMLKLIARVDEIERDLIEEKHRLEDEKQKIIKEIEQIPSETHKNILYDRYIFCKRWERIAVEQDKSIRWIFRIHKNALRSFEKVWNGH